MNAPTTASAVKSGFHASGAQFVGKGAEGAQVELFRTDLRIDVRASEGRLRARAFDPERAFNPGKVFPTPRLCGDVPGAYHAHASETAGTAGRG